MELRLSVNSRLLIVLPWLNYLHCCIPLLTDRVLRGGYNLQHKSGRNYHLKFYSPRML